LSVDSTVIVKKMIVMWSGYQFFAIILAVIIEYFNFVWLAIAYHYRSYAIASKLRINMI